MELARLTMISAITVPRQLPRFAALPVRSTTTTADFSALEPPSENTAAVAHVRTPLWIRSAVTTESPMTISAL